MVVATSLNAKGTPCNPFLIDEKPALSHQNRGYLGPPIVLVLVVVLVPDFPLWVEFPDRSVWEAGQMLAHLKSFELPAGLQPQSVNPPISDLSPKKRRRLGS